jgi:hypothetical protein
MYCGTRDMLPDGYNNFGNLYDCLKKGYGTGRGILKDKINNVIVDQNINPDALRARIQTVLEEGGGGNRNVKRTIFNKLNLSVFFIIILMGVLGLQIYTLIRLNKIEEEKKSSPS